MGDIIFVGDFEVKGRSIPQTILGYGPFMAELYYGHRSRLYYEDLYLQHESMAEVSE